MRYDERNGLVSTDGAIWMHLQTLKTLIGGSDPSGGRPPSNAERISAGEKYLQLCRQLETDEEQRSRLTMEIERQRAETLNETRRIDLEYEKLQIQKVELLVRLLEAAAKNPETTPNFLIEKLTTRLLESK